ncbi:restriction endonuclease [Bacillus cereus]|nr:restriction endonuclease [Bacillus cereus]PET05866.1 restriction endonuclease [Bacillus cereus]PFF37564.1 restriction endonuclease [Bacillus cereus]PFI48089.1 restriction endonuclease [Bacillus cereus]
MLEQLIIELAKSTKQVENIQGDKNYLIINKDDEGLDVEIKLSREQYEKEEEVSSYFKVSFELLKNAWGKFINMRTVKSEDFGQASESNTFLVAFFSQILFVNGMESRAITFKEFQTDNLPSEKYDKVMLFLEEIMNGTYNPSKLLEQTDENLYRMKSNARQDLRLLGFLNESHEMNKLLLNEYVQSEDKNAYIAQLVLKQEYFRHALFVLGLLEKYSKDEKKEALVELGMTIVRNSLGDNLMVESVARKRTNNLLDWLERVGLINDEWILVEQYVKDDGEKGGSMSSNLREKFLTVMKEYLQARTEKFAGHKMGAVVRHEMTTEITRLPFIDHNQYVITGSIGQGNWAAVPWLAIMNKDITTSTQRGYYIVYLFSEDMERLYLTLAQGVTETTKEEMQKIKDEIREQIQMSQKVKKDDDIFLGTSQKAKGYANSTAAYIAYDANKMPSEKELVEDLEEMLRYYEGFIAYKEEGTKYEMIYERKEVYLDQQSIIDHVSSYIQSKGFYYEKKDLINFFLSLKTKPFVILSGISGTGKTKIVQWFAESLGATEENGQFTLIPVRPDWSDSSDLLGYVNLQGEFQERPLIKVLENADANPNRPYFVVLDEMNLARVEYYFSDFLSVIESRKWKDGKIVTSPVLPESITNKHITIPSNVYIIGTVNMDETTHPLSKKVLDRANTIEFNTVNLDYFNFLMDVEEKEAEIVSNRSLATKYLHLKECFKENEDLVRNISAILIEINKTLESVGAQVGYRIRDEICFYMAYNEHGKLLSSDEALDYQIYQKILPRLAGSDGRTEEVLKQLYVLCAHEEYDSGNNDASYAKYPRSANKLSHMLRRFEYDGFTSFWI